MMMIMMTVTVMIWWMNGISYMIPMIHSAPEGVSLEPCYIPTHPKNSFMKIKVYTALCHVLSPMFYYKLTKLS